MKIDYCALGRRLAQIRKDRGLTQEKLAERANLANNYISNIENGRSIPSLETVVKLCQALEATPNDLLMETVQEREEYMLREMGDTIALCTPRERRLVAGFIRLLLEERKREK